MTNGVIETFGGAWDEWLRMKGIMKSKETSTKPSGTPLGDVWVSKLISNCVADSPEKYRLDKGSGRWVSLGCWKLCKAERKEKKTGLEDGPDATKQWLLGTLTALIYNLKPFQWVMPLLSCTSGKKGVLSGILERSLRLGHGKKVKLTNEHHVLQDVGWHLKVWKSWGCWVH